LEQRAKIREEFEKKKLEVTSCKKRMKRTMQHENASIFLQQKYLKNHQRLQSLVKHIEYATVKSYNNINVPGIGTITLPFVVSFIKRLIQAHLLLSRSYKYLAFHNLDEYDGISSIVDSLESVTFKVHVMFQEPKTYLPYPLLRWKWFDLAFYIDYLVGQLLPLVYPEKSNPKSPVTTNNRHMQTTNNSNELFS